MVKKLSEDETIKFVSIYRDNPCLWDITSENYKNKAMRQTALQNLCIGMEIEGFTVEDVKNKIKSIRSTYYLELDKIKKSSTSGASGNVYQPKVKWFAEFNSFIKNVMVKRKTHVCILRFLFIFILVAYYLLKHTKENGHKTDKELRLAAIVIIVLYDDTLPTVQELFLFVANDFLLPASIYFCPFSFINVSCDFAMVLFLRSQNN